MSSVAARTARPAKQQAPAGPVPNRNPAPGERTGLPARTAMPARPQAIPAEHDGALDHGQTRLESMPAIAAVHQALRAPGQPLDATTRAFVEPRFGGNFQNVRVHTDAVANMSAHAVGAVAYTAGNHIVFNRDRYAPDTVSGRRLLIHELAHVVQQSNQAAAPQDDWRVGSPSSPDEQAADAALHAIERVPRLHPSILRAQLAASAPFGPVLQRVSTWGGDWDTTKYNTMHSGGKDDGIDIELHFKPGPKVDSSEIGIVQKVTSKDKGAVVAVNPTVTARSIPAGNAGEGAHIDQLANYRNPLYATGAGAATDKLGDTATNAQWGQHGFRFPGPFGTTIQQDAVLKDTPELSDRGANASQIFEDTALALAGTQQGATYGSVQWGWQTDAAGAFTKLPLTKVSDGVPSDTFKKAEELWNKGKDSSGADLIKFQTPTQQFVQADDSPLVFNPALAAPVQIDKLAKNTSVEVIDKGTGQVFNIAKPLATWWKITVTDGAATGKTGWIRSSQLGNAKVAVGGAHAGP
jgi:hypothetical protein